MAKSKQPKKKGPGRPRVERIHPPAYYKEKALEGIKRTQQRQVGFSELDVEETVDEVLSLNGKKRFTQEEMDELRQKVNVLYQHYVTDKQEKEAELMAPFQEFLQFHALQSKEADGFAGMSRDKWNEEHGLRSNGKRKPGPPKKKKRTLWDLEPGEKGTAVKPLEPVDVDALEMDVMVERYKEQRAEGAQMLKGKRVRPDSAPSPRQKPDAKSFWI